MEGRKDDGSITISLRNFVGEGIINLKSDIFDAVKTFIEVNTISTKINSLCENFSKMCQELIDKHVLSKMTSVRYIQAWIYTEIKRLSRKKQKAYNKAKARQKTKDRDHYKSIKRKCQIECRKAYNNYNVSTMLNNDIKSNPKRLW
jgi:phage-related minor tail protein